MIVFPCSNCGAHQRAGEHLVGRRLRCQSCNTPMIVPGASAPLPPIVPQPSTGTAAALLQQPAAQSAAAPAPAPAPQHSGDDDIFFEQIRKGGRKQSKYL